MADEEAAGFAPDTPIRGRKPAPAEAGADWRGKAAGPSKGLLAGITFVALLAVGGILAGLVVWPRGPGEPLFLSVPIGEYTRAAWPVNPWADADSDRLCDHFRRVDNNAISMKAFEYQERDKFRLLLDWLAAKPEARPRGLPDDLAARPLVVHLSALAVVRGEQLYLLPGDAVPDDPATWIPIEELLSAMGACPTKHKLLILDIAKPMADPFNGVLLESVAARLDQVLAAHLKGEKAFPVLTSCSPGQLSRTADGAGHSAFAFHLADGLSGAADGYNDAKVRDEAVTVLELARFVEARVDRQARLAHDARQTPMLYAPPDSDFKLTFKPDLRPDRYDPPKPHAAYPASLAAAWADRELAAANFSDPVPLARLTDALFREEQEWLRSGRPNRSGNVQGILADAKAAAGQPSGRALADVDVLSAMSAIANYRLTRAKPKKPELLPELESLLGNWLSALKPEDAAKAKAEWQKKALAAPAEAARVVWERAVAGTTTGQSKRTVVQKWGEALEGLDFPRPPAEVLLLRTLAARDFLQEQDLSEYPWEAVLALVKAEAAVGRLLAVPPLGFEGQRPALDAANARRVSGESALFSARGEAARVKKATDDLNAARAKFEIIGVALLTRQLSEQRGQAAMSALLESSRGMAGAEGAEFAEWRAAALALAAILNGDVPLAEEAEVVRRVRTMSEALAEAKVKALLADAPTRSLPRLEHWLRGPNLPAALRPLVWTAWLDEMTKREAACRAQDKVDDDAKDATPRPTAGVGGDDIPAAVRRAEVAVALLKLAGATAEVEVPAGSPDAAAWQKLGGRLRTACRVDLPSQAREAIAHGKLALAERRLRAVPPPLASEAAWAALAEERPWHARAAADAKAYRAWAWNQLRSTDAVRKRGDAAKKFFDDVDVELTRE